MKRVAIIQPNYIPWMGYFEFIDYVDEFIVLDDVQYTKGDWRNRNKIIINNELKWLTIPVRHQSLNQTIKESRIASSNWNTKHWKTIAQNYSKTTGFAMYGEVFESLYRNCTSGFLLDVNLQIIEKINELLNITTSISLSSDHPSSSTKTERIIELCKHVGATTYVSGKKAQAYLDPGLLKKENIEIEWFEYSEMQPGTVSELDPGTNLSVIHTLFCKTQ